MVICFLADAMSINTVNWAKDLAYKNEVHILSFSMQRIPNVNVHKITYCERLGKFGYLTSLPQVRKILKRIRPDILNAYFITSYGLLGRLSCFKPLVLTSAGSDIFGGYFLSKNIIVRHLMRILIKFILRQASLILAWTDPMAKRLEALGAAPSSIFCIPRGVDLSLFYPSRIDNIAKTNKIKIVHTRSLREVYNVFSVLNVISRIKQKGHNVELLVVGDGPQRRQLEEFVDFRELKKEVKFFGKVNYENIPDFLRRCDFYISLASSDGASSSLFEAMACGLYPILSDIESNRIWVRCGKNGILVNSNNIEMIADKIISVYENRASFEKAVKVNMKIVNDRLSWELNMKLIEERIRKCYLDALSMS